MVEKPIRNGLSDARVIVWYNDCCQYVIYEMIMYDIRLWSDAFSQYSNNKIHYSKYKINHNEYKINHNEYKINAI